VVVASIQFLHLLRQRVAVVVDLTTVEPILMEPLVLQAVVEVENLLTQVALELQAKAMLEVLVIVMV
jgi:hypothetical protein